jgi:hypothetical protein
MHDPLNSTELSRRSLFERAGQAGIAAALAPLSLKLSALAGTGATPAPPDLVAETIAGFICFMLPGDDPYSVAQGESYPGPGGIAAGAVPSLTYMLDLFGAATEGAPANNSSGSGIVAGFLNDFALQVNPRAVQGKFHAPFTNLSFTQKAMVFERWEGDETVNAGQPELKFISGILPGAAAFMCFNSSGVWDPVTRKPKSTPVGWQIAGWRGPGEGFNDFKGYLGGHRSAARPRRRSLPRKANAGSVG